MSKRMRFLSISIIIVILFYIMVRIAPKVLIPPYTYDDSIVSGTPCRLPCWQGLSVGESSFEQVEQFLLQSNFVPNELLHIDESRIQWSWNLSHRGTFTFDNNILISMDITPNFRFRISDIFKFIGEPETIRGQGSSFDQQPIIALELYYPQQGIVIRAYFHIENISQIIIPYDLRGDSFEVYQPSDTLYSFISEIYPNWTGDVDQIIETDFSLGWPGFGAVVTAQPGKSIWFDPLIYITPTPE